jgi:hypothetical protein
LPNDNPLNGAVGTLTGNSETSSIGVVWNTKP